MAMLLLPNAVIAAALATAPVSASDFGAWLIELNQVTVAKPVWSAQSSTQFVADGWKAPIGESLIVKGILIPTEGNVTPTASGYKASWNISPAMLSIQEFLSYDDDWDGEGAPAPDADSVISAIEFIGSNSFVGDWTATLHADGRVALEGHSVKGDVEIIFSKDKKALLWLEGVGSRALSVSDVAAALNA